MKKLVESTDRNPDSTSQEEANVHSDITGKSTWKRNAEKVLKPFSFALFLPKT
jgi:hypothetical protein